MDVDFWASRVLPTNHFSVAHAARFNCSVDSDDKDKHKMIAYCDQGLKDVNAQFLKSERKLEKLKVADQKNKLKVKKQPAGKAKDEDDDTRACFPCPYCYMEIEISLFCSHLQEEHCFDLKNAVCPLCAVSMGKDVIGHFVVQHASSLKRRKKSQTSGFRTAGSKGWSLAISGRKYDSAPDPLLSPFLCHTPPPIPESFRQEESSGSVAITSNLKSDNSSPVDEGLERDIQEREQRAAFVQQLMAEMIF